LLNWTRENHFDIVAPNEPTRIRGKHVIDFLLTSGVNKVKRALVINELTSDHYPVLVFVGTRPTIPTETRKRLCYGLANWEKYQQLITEALRTIAAIKTPTDIDLTTETLEKSIQNAMKKAIPSKVKRPPDHLKLNDEIKNTIKDRNYIRRKYQSIGTTQLKRQLRNINKEIKRKIKRLRVEKWEDTLRDLKLSDGSLWRTAKKMRRIPQSDPSIDADNIEVFAPKEKARLMADALEKTFSPEVEGENTPKVTLDINVWREEKDNEVLPEIKDNEVQKIIDKLPSGKATGEDGIPYEVIKKIPSSAVKVLTNVINASIKLSHFPTPWKHSTIKCIPKKGGKKLKTSQFRPISLLSNLGKVVERVVAEHLNKIIDDMALLPNEQFGFRKGRSTTHQIHKLIEHISESFNNKDMTIGVFLDVSKAFDKVWHDGLLYKMQTAKLPKWLLLWTQSYLNDRTFTVKWDGESSSLKRFEAGVPQGSVLGPTLFNLFTMDFPKSPNWNNDLALYADDVALLAKSKKVTLAIKYAQEALDQAVSWYKKWRLRLNTDKTQAVIFTRPRTKADKGNNIRIDQKTIEWKTSANYLGVILDENLTMKKHVDNMTGRAFAMRATLSPILRSSTTPPEIRTKIYDIFIRPTILYGAPAWANLITKGIKERLEINERKLLRTILKLKSNTENQKVYEIAKIKDINEVIHNNTKNYFIKAKESEIKEVVDLARDTTRENDKYRRPFMAS
jgi:hypothetical protein